MSQNLPGSSAVDFAYAFAPPHRITVALPDSSNKTLLDLSPGMLRIAWTYENLTGYPLGAYMYPPAKWEVHVRPEVDGQPFARTTWTRMDGVLPALVNTCSDDRGTFRLEVLGGETAMIARVEITNTASDDHRYALPCGAPGTWANYNPAAMNPTLDRDVLLAGWAERADRVTVLLLGGEEYEVRGNAIFPAWRLAPGQEALAWIIRPYNAYVADLPRLRKYDWAKEFDAAKQTWHDLLARAVRISIPDDGVRNAYYACLADLFIMREPVAGGYVAGTPGTEIYRAPNSFEAAIAAVALDQAGLHESSAAGYQMCLDQQEADGDWTEPRGWGHHMWAGTGFKAWAVMQHYRLTGDHAYLRRIYPHMLASSRWQERQRATTRVTIDGQPSPAWGLMPPGVGDAGLMNDGSLFGVFLPHNIWAVYADRLALEAAGILGKKKDIPELERICQTALADLLAALDRGAILEPGYRWLPGVMNKTCGSRWGVLNAAWPCGVLPLDHELINGTIRKIESSISPGGIPMNTGWMANGMWVAIALDNLAEVHLARGGGDASARYLAATLNHGTPLCTWCEERGQQPGTTECSGDRQHLWTPVAVVRLIRDSLVMEDGMALHLARGADRSWLGSGLPVGIENAATHFGRVSYQLVFHPGAMKVIGTISLPDECELETLTVHLRLPGGLRVAAATRGTIGQSGEGITLHRPRGRCDFEAVLHAAGCRTS